MREPNAKPKESRQFMVRGVIGKVARLIPHMIEHVRPYLESLIQRVPVACFDTRYSKICVFSDDDLIKSLITSA